MADSRPFDSFRLTLMQEVLPVGLAMVERIRQGGPASVVEPFTGSADPLGDLRAEGASPLRRCVNVLIRSALGWAIQ